VKLSKTKSLGGFFREIKNSLSQIVGVPPVSIMFLPRIEDWINPASIVLR
jgi:hypothetical protein